MNSHNSPRSGPLPAIQDKIKSVSFQTLGCKLNRSETDAIAAEFAARGYRLVPFKEPADLAVINTCTVTGEADAKSRQAISRAARLSGAKWVVAMGCYTQMHAGEAAAIDGVDVVLGSGNKFDVLSLVDELPQATADGPLVLVTPYGEQRQFDDTPFISATSRTRAFLKVQDGCDFACSYCIIPSARGGSRSRPLESCLREARQLVARGYTEAVLTGVNIGDWRAGESRFDDLLDAISRVEGLRRIRVSSIEPNLVTRRTLALMAERDNICPHLHIPLQHSSDKVLKAMRRRYTWDDYQRLAQLALETVPDLAIGADVITGFPGETEEDFEHLARALSDLPAAYYHIFRYSEREGTLATALAGRVEPPERKRRSDILRQIGERRRAEYARGYLRQTRPVLFESEASEGVWSGLTDNYLRVLAPATDDLSARYMPVTLTRFSGGIVTGKLAA